MTQQLHVAGLPQAIEDGYFDTANANKSSVRVHGGQSSEFPIYPTTLERTIYRENAITIESEARDPSCGNVYYVTMQITFPIPEFARKEQNALG